MGLIKGALTFSRYRVEGDLPDKVGEFIDDKIKLFSFREIKTSDEEKSLGWTSLENILDTHFEYANYSLGDYIVFSLRIDKRLVPAALLRLKILEEEKRYMEEKGKERLYKAEKNDIKESVRLNLLRKTPPVPSFYEVCWSVSGKWVLFGSLTEKAKDDFEEFFKRSFNLRLIPSVPWDPFYLDPEKISGLKSLEGHGSVPFLR